MGQDSRSDFQVEVREEIGVISCKICCSYYSIDIPFDFPRLALPMFEIW